MTDEIAKLKAWVIELEKRQADAIDQLHHLANETVHHSKFCNHPMMVDWEDLEEVIDILKGE